jgi:tRNA pseudouridine55 synthase
MESFLGTSLQVPPAFSAKKIDGRRAYRMARTGEPVEPAPIEVTIDRFVAEEIRTDTVDFRVVCSGGTYVRSLARDLGRRLGIGAHLSRLRRTRSGPFLEAQAVRLENVGSRDVIHPVDFLDHLPRIEVDDESVEAIGHGRSVPSGGEEGYLCIFNKKRDLLAIAWRKEGWAHPEVVLL